MADSLHNTLATFRDSILQSIARLEFQLRDSAATLSNHSHESNIPSQALFSRILAIEQSLQEYTNPSLIRQTDSILTRLGMIEERLNAIEEATQRNTQEEPSHEIEEILTIEEPSTTRNIVIPSIRSTPALAAAVAAANPEPVVLDSASEVTGEVVEEEDESESEDSGPELTKVIIKGISYYMDESNTVYQETEDGYEEVGTYNPKLDRIEVAPEEVEEDDEEAIETEEFVYKGHTYQRDAEGNVYDDEGNGIGHWNGKKIVAVAVA
jgi:hypothetical protein